MLQHKTGYLTNQAQEKCKHKPNGKRVGDNPRTMKTMQGQD